MLDPTLMLTCGRVSQPLAVRTLERWWAGRKQRRVINMFMRMKKLLEYKVGVTAAPGSYVACGRSRVVTHAETRV